MRRAPEREQPARPPRSDWGSFLPPIADDMFVEITVGARSLWLKLEGCNPAGSIKIKTARALLDDLEAKGLLRPGVTVVESSSGNLGIALSLLCAARGLPFRCICDPNTAPSSRDLMMAHGAHVEIVEERDDNGGYLGTRLVRLEALLADPAFVWTRQYSNAAAKQAHHRWTGPALLRRLPTLDYLFVGIGTAGTAMGLAEYLRQAAPNVRVIGVDSCGSMTFGRPAGRRYLPGLGMSQPSMLFDRSLIHDTIEVPEAETIRTCFEIRARYGLLVGPSTGTVLAAATGYMDSMPPGATIAAISPDMGEHYLGTLYNHRWLAERFPDLVLPGGLRQSAR